VRARKGDSGGPDTSGGSSQSRISISFCVPGAPFGPEGWRLSIDGPGPADVTAGLRELAERLGIGADVDIGGPVPMSRLGEHFAALDLFVLPSRSEAFALTVGEALASGVPAVVTTEAPWGGVETHRCGWSVPPTLAGLTDAIAHATALSAADLASMGQRGRAWVRDDYAWKEIARRHLTQLYDVPVPW